MKRHLKFFAAFYFSFLILGVFSCEKKCKFDDPINYEVAVTDISLQARKIIDGGVGVFPNTEILTETNIDPVIFDKYAIHIQAVKRQQFAVTEEKEGWVGLIPACYACSPIEIASTVNKLTDIAVFTSGGFDNRKEDKINVTSFFDVVVYAPEQNNLSGKYDLTTYLRTNPVVPENLILILKKAPATAKKYTFDVTFKQTGSKIGEFNYSTLPVEITTK